MKLKMDLHTHCYEATYIPLPKLIDRVAVKKIVTSVKSKGLDGIAITEHYRKEFGTTTRDIISKHFDNQIIIIPGREIYSQGYHLVELFFPDDIVFRFLPHPIYDERLEKHYDFSKIHGIEIGNHYYDPYIDKPRIRALAEKYNLLLLSNSDAHDLNNIGYHYNEICLDDLINRAQTSSEGGVNTLAPHS